MDFSPAKAIVQDGDPVLRAAARPVPAKDIGSPELKKLIKTMRELLAQEKNGVGLAAPQVGVPIQLFMVAGRVFETQTEENDEKRKTENKKSPEPHPLDRVFINPELVRKSRAKKEMSEGCLSVRGVFGTVMRHEKATIKALDENGKPMTVNGSGLLAHIFQHEVDHLNGVLFIDKALSLDKKKEIQDSTQ